MNKSQTVPLNSDNVQIKMNPAGIVEVLFGPLQINIDLDTAYDLQFELATFLAKLELIEYQKEQALLDPQLLKSKSFLETFYYKKKLADYDA